MRVLITGITGMMGSVLAQEWLRRAPEAEVFGTHRWRSRMGNVEPFKHRVRLRECDVRDQSNVRRLLHEIQPDRIFHLAAQSNVPTSLHAPADTLATNVVGLVNLLEAMRELRSTARILVPGSSEEYGLQQPDELPARETNFLRPLSPYGVSKVAQDMTGLQYFESYGLHIVRTRAFNHTGPGREDVFVESNLARQIAEIEAGLRPPILHVGNLDVVRDYSDVRDIARAYVLALENGTAGEVYNICSGQAVRIGQMVDMLLSMTSVPIEVRQDPSRVRSKEALQLTGDASRFRALTGWEPEIPLHDTLRDILGTWRAIVRGAAGATAAQPHSGG